MFARDDNDRITTDAQRHRQCRRMIYWRPSLCLCVFVIYFRPSEALISATVVSRSGARLWIDMTCVGSSFSLSMLSTNTIVPMTGGLGTGSFAGGRLNM